jgi:hypothetical protein
MTVDVVVMLWTPGDIKESTDTVSTAIMIGDIPTSAKNRCHANRRMMDMDFHDV